MSIRNHNQKMHGTKKIRKSGTVQFNHISQSVTSGYLGVLSLTPAVYTWEYTYIIQIIHIYIYIYRYVSYIYIYVYNFVYIVFFYIYIYIIQWNYIYTFIIQNGLLHKQKKRVLLCVARRTLLVDCLCLASGRPIPSLWKRLLATGACSLFWNPHSRGGVAMHSCTSPTAAMRRSSLSDKWRESAGSHGNPRSSISSDPRRDRELCVGPIGDPVLACKSLDLCWVLPTSQLGTCRHLVFDLSWEIWRSSGLPLSLTRHLAVESHSPESVAQWQLQFDLCLQLHSLHCLQLYSLHCLQLHNE